MGKRDNPARPVAVVRLDHGHYALWRGEVNRMSQRRMPSGQGPSRGGLRVSGAPGSRPGAQRSAARRVSTRIQRPDAAPRPGARNQAASAETRTAESRASEGRARIGGIRRSAGPARRTKAPRRPRRISGRAAAVGLLLVALTLAYAYPVRVFLAQQAEIDQMETSQTEQRKRIQELTERLARWDDPEYVAAQARTRLQLVRKGELLFVVQKNPQNPATSGPENSSSWLSQLWSSVEAADNPPPDASAKP